MDININVNSGNLAQSIAEAIKNSLTGMGGGGNASDGGLTNALNTLAGKIDKLVIQQKSSTAFAPNSTNSNSNQSLKMTREERHQQSLLFKRQQTEQQILQSQLQNQSKLQQNSKIFELKQQQSELQNQNKLQQSSTLFEQKQSQSKLQNQNKIEHNTKLFEQKQAQSSIQSQNKMQQDSALSKQKLQQSLLSQEEQGKLRAQQKIQEKDKLFEQQKQQSAENFQIRLQQDAERSQQKQNTRNQQRWNNIGRGIATGSLLSVAYQAGNYGTAIGGEARAINTSPLNYNSFLKDYYNTRLESQKSVGSSLSFGLGAGIGALLTPAMPGLGGTIGGVIGGGIGSYLLGSNTEQKKAFNELASNQDLLSYSMYARGMSPMSNKNMTMHNDILGKDIKIPLTQLQAYMAGNKELAPYMSTLGQVIGGARQDVFSGQNEKDINRRIRSQGTFAKQVTQSALLTGTTDIAGLTQNVTNVSSLTGKNATEILTKLTNDNMKYGGDMVANTAKIVQLMQGSSMSLGQASNLINRYQYNQAEMQNQINMRQSPYMNKAVGRLLMEVSGASPSEIKAGRWSEHNLSRYRNASANASIKNFDPLMSIMQASFGNLGQDPYVSNGGAVKATVANTAQTTAMQKAVNNMVADNIRQMMVTATNVYINGNIKTNHNDNIVDKFKNANTALVNYAHPNSIKSRYQNMNDLAKQVQNNQIDPDYFKIPESHVATLEWDRRERANAMAKLQKMGLQNKNRSGSGTVGVHS